MARTKHPLKAYLFTHGMTQVDFATRIGTAQERVSECMSGIKLPTMRFMIAVARETKGTVMPNDWLPAGWKKREKKNV